MDITVSSDDIQKSQILLDAARARITALEAALEAILYRSGNLIVQNPLLGESDCLMTTLDQARVALRAEQEPSEQRREDLSVIKQFVKEQALRYISEDELDALARVLDEDERSLT